MEIPKWKRVKTIGIRFTKGEKNEEIMEKIIVDKLGIPVDELTWMANFGRFRHMVRVRSEQMYKHICDRYVGYTIRVDKDHDIQIDDLSSYKDRVKVTRLPYEISKRKLGDILGQYGLVEKVIMCTKSEGKFKGVPIDEAVVVMKLSHPIPSSLWIVESQTNMFFYYDNQPQSCNRCGSLEHLAVRCDVYQHVHPDDRSNAIHVDLVEEELENESTHKSGNKGSNTEKDNGNLINGGGNENDNSGDKFNDNAINNEVINEFKCKECDKECKTGHELNEHIKIHRSRSNAQNVIHNLQHESTSLTKGKENATNTDDKFEDSVEQIQENLLNTSKSALPKSPNKVDQNKPSEPISNDISDLSVKCINDKWSQVVKKSSKAKRSQNDLSPEKVDTYQAYQIETRGIKKAKSSRKHSL